MPGWRAGSYLPLVFYCQDGGRAVTYPQFFIVLPGWRAGSDLPSFYCLARIEGRQWVTFSFLLCSRMEGGQWLTLSFLLCCQDGGQTVTYAQYFVARMEGGQWLCYHPFFVLPGWRADNNLPSFFVCCQDGWWSVTYPPFLLCCQDGGRAVLLPALEQLPEQCGDGDAVTAARWRLLRRYSRLWRAHPTGASPHARRLLWLLHKSP